MNPLKKYLEQNPSESLGKIAAKTGIPKPSLGHYVADRHRVPRDRAWALAEQLGFDVSAWGSRIQDVPTKQDKAREKKRVTRVEKAKRMHAAGNSYETIARALKMSFRDISAALRGD
jgi:plasmid maintenance system antidote protein VapI